MNCRVVRKKASSEWSERDEKCRQVKRKCEKKRETVAGNDEASIVLTKAVPLAETMQAAQKQRNKHEKTKESRLNP